MTDFSADWLTLREPADAAARAPALTSMLSRLAGRREGLRVIDLGTGTGANLRFLAPRLGGAQDWLLIDSDEGLLGNVSELTRAWCAQNGLCFAEEGRGFQLLGRGVHCRADTCRLDLAAGIEWLGLSSECLVTASALLDLVSDDWLAALAGHCRAVRATVLFVLNYDGRVRLAPEEPEDEQVGALLNAHQLRNKGFGPALGPAAALRAQERFAAQGYEARVEPSDWSLGPAEAALQEQLLEGLARAAGELAPDHAARWSSWLERRIAHVRAGRSGITVGHRDLIAWLP